MPYHVEVWQRRATGMVVSVTALNSTFMPRVSAAPGRDELIDIITDPGHDRVSGLVRSTATVSPSPPAQQSLVPPRSNPKDTAYQP